MSMRSIGSIWIATVSAMSVDPARERVERERRLVVEHVARARGLQAVLVGTARRRERAGRFMEMRKIEPERRLVRRELRHPPADFDRAGRVVVPERAASDVVLKPEQNVDVADGFIGAGRVRT